MYREYTEKSKIYRFQGLKTPPGRCRTNVPLRNPEKNPSREERANDLSRRSDFVKEPANSNLVPLGRSESGLDRRQQLARDRSASSSSSTAASAATALSQNLINLDGLFSNPTPSSSRAANIISPPSSSSNSSVDTSNESQVTVIDTTKGPFNELDPLSKDFKGDPKNSAGYSFDVARKFGTRKEEVGGRKRKETPVTSPTDTVKTKRGRPTTKNNGAGAKSTKVVKSAAKTQEKSVKTSLLKSIIVGNRAKSVGVGETDKDSDTESDTVTAEINDTFDLDI